MDWIKYLGLYFLLFLLFVFLLPPNGFEGDLVSWWAWASWIQQKGLANIYQTSANYHPLWLYVLSIYGDLEGSRDDIAKYVYRLKVVPLLFDFLSAFLVYWIVPLKPKNYLLPLFLLLNLAYLYNTVIWGQIDSIPTFFIAVSLFFALQQKANRSVLFFVLGLYTKLQVIIFLPIIGLLLLPTYFNSPKKIASTALVLIVSQVILLLPFLIGGTVDEFWQVVTGAVGHFPMTSLNAFNFWYLLYLPELNPAELKDSTELWGQTIKFWGFVFFFSGSFVVLLPLLRSIFFQIKSKIIDHHLTPLAFLSAGLITILFFFFNTQMHERYSHSALLFFFLYGVSTRRYGLYILTSLAYFFNMEKVLQEFPIFVSTTLIFDPRFVALLYSLLLILGTWQLYRFFWVKTLKK